MTDELHPDHEPADEPLDADVERLRSLLADVPAASAQARESAITAALAEFDAVHGSTPVRVAAAAFSAPVVDLAARRRWPARFLTVAAAVAALGVVGIAAFGSGSDSKRSGTAADQRTASATEVLAGGGAPSTIGAINGAADARLPIDSPDQLKNLQAPTVAPEAAPSETFAGADSTMSVADAKYAIAPYSCLSGDQQFLADITYRGIVAIAARDTVTGVTQAIDEQCNVLVEVGP